MSISGSLPPKHYTMAELKSKVLNKGLSQTSVYLVNISSPNSDITSFIRGQRNLNYDGEILNLLCCDASLPGTSLATHEVNNDHSGVTEKMAYRRIYDDSIDLSFYVDGEYKVLSYFDSWMDFITGEGITMTTDEYINNDAYYRMIYPSKYKTNIYLTKFEKDYKQSQQALSYVFVDAFPTNVVSMPISYESSNILKCTVSFSYTRYVRKPGLVSTSGYTLPQTPSSQAASNSPGNPELRVAAAAPGGSVGSDGFYNTPGGGTGTSVGSDGFFNTPGGGTGTSVGSDGFVNI